MLSVLANCSPVCVILLLQPPGNRLHNDRVRPLGSPLIVYVLLLRLFIKNTSALHADL